MDYGKDLLIKSFVITVFVVFSLVFLGSLGGSDSDQSLAVFFFGIWLISFRSVLNTFMSKITLEEDRVIVKKGVFKRIHEELKYSKINNVVTTNILGIGGIKIFVGNDKPILFPNLSRFQEVKSKILDKIDD